MTSPGGGYAADTCHDVGGRQAVSGGNSGHIRVAVRVRPLPAGDDGIIEVGGAGVIAIRKEAATGGNQFLSTQQGRIEERNFDHVFGPDATQTEVYAWSCEPLISEAVAKGRSATVFVYGATGAGKTHTMFGKTDPDQRGIIFRAIPEVFRCLQEVEAAAPPGSFEVKVSFLEIYNEVVRDLLQPTSLQDGAQSACKVLEDASRGVVKVANLLEAPARNPDEALWYLQAGMQARTVEATAANQQSSRAHAVFSLTIEQIRDSKGSGAFSRRMTQVRALHSKISLIDLAGSERAALTQNTGNALKDGASINKSLLALANCIDALTQRGPTSGTPRKKPPYRDSKLTLMLKGSLTGDGLVAMIANVHPGRTHFEDSNNTLEYAKRASVVRAQTGRRKSVTAASVQPSPAVLPTPNHQNAGGQGPFSCWEVSATNSRRQSPGEFAELGSLEACSRQQPADSGAATTASNTTPEDCLSEISLTVDQADCEAIGDGELLGTNQACASGGSTTPDSSDTGGTHGFAAHHSEAADADIELDLQDPVEDGAAPLRITPGSDQGSSGWAPTSGSSVRYGRVAPGEAPMPTRKRRQSRGETDHVPCRSDDEGGNNAVTASASSGARADPCFGFKRAVTASASSGAKGSSSLAEQILVTVQAEKAQLSQRLSGVVREREGVIRERDAMARERDTLLQDRRQLEEENERLRVASIEKDRLLVQLLAKCSAAGVV